VTLDVLSNGRFQLGLGLGRVDKELKAYGVDRKERVGRLEDAIEVAKLAFTGEPFSFQGKSRNFEDVQIYSKPIQSPRPPILIGAEKPPGIERAGRMADGFIAPYSYPNVATLREMVDIARRGAQGRTDLVRPFQIVVMKHCFISEGGDAWQQFERSLAYRVLAHPREAELFAQRPPSEEQKRELVEKAREGALLGTPAEVLEQLREHESALGTEVEIMVRVMYPGISFEQSARQIELIGKHIIPKLS
jgi:alkanesulfonate monooxygenase SsuD/methylene tetrahydromethanopterin reductase-like flavin-dependent oxidoreductase (luciferase family)